MHGQNNLNKGSLDYAFETVGMNYQVEIIQAKI